MANTWVFQANPNEYLVDEALKAFNEHTWLVNKHRNEIHVGDKVLIWKCGRNAALVGIGTVLTEPAEIEARPEEKRFEKEPIKFAGKKFRVRVRAEAVRVPIPRKRMLDDPILRSWFVVRGCQGTNFRVSSDIEMAIGKMLA